MGRARATKGPITGQAKRPTRQPLETSRAKIATRAGALRALASSHRSELALLSAAQMQERSLAHTRLGAARSARKVLARAEVAARYAAQRAGIPKDMPELERIGLLARLAAEEAAEITTAIAAVAAQERERAQTEMAGLKLRHSNERRGLRTRHRHARAVAAIILRPLLRPIAKPRSKGRHGGTAGRATRTSQHLRLRRL